MVAFIGGIGGQEVLMILAIALVIFGPKRIPAIARSLSKITLQFRQASRQFQREIYSNIDPTEIIRKATGEEEGRKIDELYRRGGTPAEGDDAAQSPAASEASVPEKEEPVAEGRNSAEPKKEDPQP